MALTGKTIEHPNFHTGPSQTSPTTAVLQPDLPLQLIGLEGDYFRVILPDNREGYVHRDLVVVDGQSPPKPPAQGETQAVVRGVTVQTPNLHEGPSQASRIIAVLAPGVGLSLLGLENSYWHVKLDDGRIGYVHTDLVVPAGSSPTGGNAPAGTLVLSVANPFDEAGYVTSSSHQGHHVVFGGAASFDLDTAGPSRGTPVHFRISCSGGVAVRGHVDHVGMACGNQILANGGRWAGILIERQEAGAWVSTGQHLHYAHMDPMNVVEGQIVESGFVLGLLGPAIAAGFAPADAAVAACNHTAGSPMLDEFHSTCALHSHTHIEGTGAPAINDQGVICSVDAAVMTMTL